MTGYRHTVTEHDNEPLPDAEWFTWPGDMGQPVPLVRRARAYVDSLHNVAGLDALILNVSPAAAEAWRSISGSITDENHLARYLREVITADTKLILQDLDSAWPENVNKALATASREGIAKLSPVQLLPLVLVWLLAFGMPLVQQTLPPEAQAVITGDVGYRGPGDSWSRLSLISV